MNKKVKMALDRLAELEGAPLAEYRDALNDELCHLTGSELAYIAAMNLEEDVLTMVGWSRSAMEACGIEQRPIVYLLEETGLWGDAVRERQAVITNDYAKSTRPTKKGYPKGHVHVINHMNVPIYDGDRIALVVGVGNKDGGYTMDDAYDIEDLMNEVWDIFRMTLWEGTF
ncbi:MAG: GAF domain-containing protein [Chloroflexi bacterium]|nr:GAF domain-containing protein [Chloroflexota bacterium]